MREVFKPGITRLSDIDTHMVDVLRLDLIHPVAGGNKYYKLKYNLEEARKSGHNTICTFGGAYSNHIAATALACREAGIKCIGVIRGEDRNNSPTIQFARENGMKLIFVDRDTYSRKDEKSFIGNLHREFGEFYLIPEGGKNAEGVKGAKEIISDHQGYDYVVCACGTGTTYAGILGAVTQPSIAIGISVLKGKNELPASVNSMANIPGIQVSGDEEFDLPVIKNHCILSTYGFSGYARFDRKLVEFKQAFEKRSGISVDHVYTVKAFFAVYELCRLGKIPPGSKVLVIHSGGVQGNAGFEKRYQRKLNL